ncbi:hypothetical protein BU15DRAFT_65151 [Melanogaster broomeanus]|nr:hypothetical protein BU15DRAFT_65151 [Melanogaster broomeanus]
MNLEVVDTKFCVFTYKTTILEAILLLIPQLILSILICSLAVGKLVAESLQMHQAVKQWRLNRFFELFARECILFVSVESCFNLPVSDFFFCLASFLNAFGSGSTSTAGRTLLTLVASIFPYVLVPRFVISVRELCSNVVGGHVDTGFGVVSEHISTHHNIVFASAGEMLASGADMAAGVGTGGGDAGGRYELGSRWKSYNNSQCLQGVLPYTCLIHEVQCESARAEAAERKKFRTDAQVSARQTKELKCTAETKARQPRPEGQRLGRTHTVTYETKPHPTHDRLLGVGLLGAHDKKDQGWSLAAEEDCAVVNSKRDIV